MIVSHKHQFIFIKTRKTAGTSLELALSEFCGEKDVITLLTEKEELLRPANGLTPRNYLKKFPWEYSFKEIARWFLYAENRKRGVGKFEQHTTAETVKKELGEKVWNSYYKFCFERNPWEKTVSAYFFHLHFTTEKPTFKEFVKGYSFFGGMPIYADKDGKVLVDYIAKFENMDQELAYIGKAIGIPLHNNLPKAKAGIRPEKAHYSTYYDEESMRVVGEKCKFVIDLMGYKFEREPGK